MNFRSWNFFCRPSSEFMLVLLRLDTAGAWLLWKHGCLVNCCVPWSWGKAWKENSKNYLTCCIGFNLQHIWESVEVVFWEILEGVARYAGLLLAPAEGFGRGRFLQFGQKKRAFYICFGPDFGHFWWSVVTSVTFSSNLSNLKKIQKIQKIQKSQQIQKSQKNSKKTKKPQNIPKIS